MGFEWPAKETTERSVRPPRLEKSIRRGESVNKGRRLHWSRRSNVGGVAGPSAALIMIAFHTFLGATTGGPLKHCTVFLQFRIQRRKRFHVLQYITYSVLVLVCAWAVVSGTAQDPSSGSHEWRQGDGLYALHREV
ncbi:hypothetical protein B0T26DRAFT_399791 [Lasiosphaeria miniovina]|uniref:Uncharacterized protein n=1 Tax=Lasiosphaeria miniovina TaxID=1954250 RepID=A0AA40A4N2_9PEZI|nr:uncharacterized protein B0T26DRAFT_399791 [Lasiosphaeria miniovina]KAK0709256.1 hypothetical protein B0T26DRAFT_399791 [Lasiosphaeria miniovina]